jgi:N-acetylglucosaminyldiphosphoundecaprenol N-acetyl-beta-D-mannosaminyltransferase
MPRRFGDFSWNTPDTGDVPAKQASRRSARRRAVQSPRASRLPVVEVHGVELHAVTEAQAIDFILAELDDGRGGMVVTPNLDYIRRCNKDLHFAAMVSEADLAVADGMPVIWASRLMGTPLPERVAGSNLITSLNGAAARHGRRVYFLGGAPGAAEGAIKVLREKFPTLNIVGSHCPQMGFEKSERLWEEMEQDILAAQPDIIWVALGAPKQEFTIARLRTKLPKAWFLGVGVSFSFLAGQVQRAPKWMQKVGLEWAHRLVQEPGKLWKRYLLSGVPFALSMLGAAACKGVPTRINRWRFPAELAATEDVIDGDTNGSTKAADAANPEATAVSGTSSAGSNGMPSGLTPLSATAPRTTRVSGEHSVEQILQRLKAMILLGGSVRPSPLSAATGRSVLDLPLDENGSLMNYWLAQAQDVAKLAGQERLPVRVLVNHASREPTTAAENYFGSFRVERDLSEYRGTGGVLRDVAADYADDDFLLVANACQILLDPLPAIVSALAKQGGDINLVAHDDGTPTGIQLLRCKTLREIAHNGYHDLKEQALPKIASAFDVRAMRRRRPTGLPIRTLEDYLQALRLYHRRRAGKPLVTDPLAEDWSPAFSLVEPGAKVSPNARVHDSVVLNGATVEAGAVLVRSLVCGDAAVRTDRTVVDQYVTAAPRPSPGPVPIAATW